METTRTIEGVIAEAGAEGYLSETTMVELRRELTALLAACEARK